MSYFKAKHHLLLVFLGLSMVLSACGGSEAGTTKLPSNTASSQSTVAGPNPTTGAVNMPTAGVVSPIALPGDYDIGNPVVKELWVNPNGGKDDNDGSSRATALRTLTAAWNKIPQGSNLSGNGFKIMLMRGSYAEDMIPNYLESRYGTAQFPVIIQSADGKGMAILKGDLNIFEARYLYLIDLNIVPEPAGDAYHCERCDHILIRGTVLSGGNRQAHETIKINQSSYVYIENSDISGADDNAIDFVAVQNGHVRNNRIHNAEDWCMYAKGGSAYLTIEANEVFNCGTGGLTAGQGTGFEFMTAPWLHYEAYDIKIINNVIHDTQGAGLGANGGYNILLAYNTLYKVGQRSHLIEVTYGERSCDGDAAKCADNLKVGGWGVKAAGIDPQPIPSRNVYIYNNLVFNPTGYQSGSQHFALYGPRITEKSSNIPSPATIDVNLQIKGNLIWNGPADHALGIEDTEQGCQRANATCNLAQLQQDNSINKLEPQLVNPAGGDFKLTAGSNVKNVKAFALPAFPGGDRAVQPQAPQGVLENVVGRDRVGAERTQANSVGAYK